MRPRGRAAWLLLSMAGGDQLKSHRELDGRKAYRLHTTEGHAEEIPPALVEKLRRQRLIDSNKKFPVATFWLTDRGREATASFQTGK